MPAVPAFRARRRMTHAAAGPPDLPGARRLRRIRAAHPAEPKCDSRPFRPKRRTWLGRSAPGGDRRSVPSIRSVPPLLSRSASHPSRKGSIRQAAAGTCTSNEQPQVDSHGPLRCHKATSQQRQALRVAIRPDSIHDSQLFSKQRARCVSAPALGKIFTPLKLEVSWRSRLQVTSATREITPVPPRISCRQRDWPQPREAAAKCANAGRMRGIRRVDISDRLVAAWVLAFELNTTCGRSVGRTMMTPPRTPPTRLVASST